MKNYHSNYHLEDIQLGNISGENEADYMEDFENLYYDGENFTTEALEPRVFFIIGRKGAGKTLLARYLQKIHSNCYNKFSKVISFRNFKFFELLEFRQKEFQLKEYIYFWKWCLLINLADILLKDESIQAPEKISLYNFIKENFGLNFDQNRIIDKTKNMNVGGSLKFFEGSITKSTKSEKGSYIDYLTRLEESILSICKSTTSEFYLFCDELDDRFGSDNLYNENVQSLIYAVVDLNRNFHQNNLKVKCMLLLRTDIFKILNFPDLNKFKIDNSLLLDWQPELRENSPLFSMIIYKICSSLGLGQTSNLASQYYKFFPDRIHTCPSSQYIINHTLCRPRDFIHMLNLIIKKYPKFSFFSPNSFIETELSFSRYLLSDIRNEMMGHKSDKFINDSFELIRNLGKNTFNIDFLKIRKPYLFDEKGSDNYVREILQFLFQFSVIGNIIHDPDDKQKNIAFSFAHREDTLEPDYSITFTIHQGLRSALRAGKMS